MLIRSKKDLTSNIAGTMQGTGTRCPEEARSEISCFQQQGIRLPQLATEPRPKISCFSLAEEIYRNGPIFHKKYMRYCRSATLINSFPYNSKSPFGAISISLIQVRIPNVQARVTI